MKTLLILATISFLSVSCGKRTTVIQGGKHTTVIQGTPGPSGAPGESITGPTGQNGSNGRDGQDGRDGQNGQNAQSQVRMINICDNQLRENKYSEEAICISENNVDRLFVVMSGSTSALVELLPDTFYQTSSAMGNNCKFYVGSGCDIKFIEEI